MAPCFFRNRRSLTPTRHLAYFVDSCDEVERPHEAALAAGWTAVREPKPYPRFAPDYFAVFVEEANGIRLEFAYCPGDNESDGDADGSPADEASVD